MSARRQRIRAHGGRRTEASREGTRGRVCTGRAASAMGIWRSRRGNTIYVDAALRQLRKDGFEVKDEDVARLSPLGYEHINMLGRYAFSLPARIARGELRPLRNPALLDEAA